MSYNNQTMESHNTKKLNYTIVYSSQLYKLSKKTTIHQLNKRTQPNKIMEKSIGVFPENEEEDIISYVKGNGVSAMSDPFEEPVYRGFDGGFEEEVFGGTTGVTIGDWFALIGRTKPDVKVALKEEPLTRRDKTVVFA